MRTTIAVMLVVAGLGLALYGLGSALFELIGLYGSTLEKPLEQPEGNISRQMLTDVAIGALGIIPLLIGSVLLKISLLQRIRKARQSSAARNIRH